MYKNLRQLASHLEEEKRVDWSERVALMEEKTPQDDELSFVLEAMSLVASKVEKMRESDLNQETLDSMNNKLQILLGTAPDEHKRKKADGMKSWYVISLSVLTFIVGFVSAYLIPYIIESLQ